MEKKTLETNLFNVPEGKKFYVFMNRAITGVSLSFEKALTIMETRKKEFPEYMYAIRSLKRNWKRGDSPDYIYYGNRHA